MNQSLEMMSLFDYLKRPAGPSLGKEVAKSAFESKIPMERRQVSTKNYTGEVILYPRFFLQNYFKENA